MGLGTVDNIGLIFNAAFFVEPLCVVFVIVPAAPAVRDGYVFGMRHFIVECQGTGLRLRYCVVRRNVGDDVPMF